MLKSQRPITVIFRAFLNLFSMVFKRLLICSFFHETDLLTLTPHTPTPEPVRYDKKDGQWYTHDGVDVKDTQSRKGVFSTDNFQNYFSNFNLPLNFYKNNIGASSANENMGLLLVFIVSSKVTISSFDFGQFDLDFLQRW